MIVEDGSIVPDADSYLSVEDADTYHADRGNAAWAELAEAAKEAALIKATDYLTQKYRGRWKGSRVSAEQSLDWPREGVYVDGFAVPDDEVPHAVRKACAELALISVTETLNPAIARGVKREKVGELEIEYQDGAAQVTQYRVADNTLAPYLKPAGLVRA